jgi:rhodanese-related sulfurtransferase
MRNLFVLIVLFVGFSACKGQTSPNSSNDNVAIVNHESDDLTATIEEVYQDVDIVVAKKMVSVPNSKVIPIDVRTKSEIEAGMIKNALHIDISSPDFRSQIDKLDRNKSYLVYCHAGSRSKKAVEIMKEMGFKSLHNLSEGYRAWND